MAGSVPTVMIARRTQPTDAQISPSRAVGIGLVARLVLVAAGIAAMAVVLLWVWAGIGAYAQHSCNWPATISCDQGSPVWWLVLLSLGTVATIAAWGLLKWARYGSHRISWLVVPWLAGFGPVVVIMGPRRFGPADLWIETLYVSVGIVLASAIAVQSAPATRRLIIRVALMALAVVSVVALMLPSVLSAAWNNQRL